MQRLTRRYANGLAYYDMVPGGSVIDRLADIEDILGEEYDLDRLRELVEADRDGRCKILPECSGKNCGTCSNFRRIQGTRRGTCDIKKHPVNRYGQENKDREFQPVQSQIACKKYVPAEAALKGGKND